MDKTWCTKYSEEPVLEYDQHYDYFETAKDFIEWVKRSAQ